VTEGERAGVGLNLDSKGTTDEEYRQLWDRLGRIEIRCVEKNGQCRHNVGDTTTTTECRPKGSAMPF
jgi:hypothetical protein